MAAHFATAAAALAWMFAEWMVSKKPSVLGAISGAVACGRIDLQKAIVTVGAAKTPAGEGRTIPLNVDVLEALVEHSKWFLKKFGTTHPLLYVFPFGRPQPTDATRHVTTFSTVWTNVKNACGIKGRWHDNRHTFYYRPC